MTPRRKQIVVLLVFPLLLVLAGSPAVSLSESAKPDDGDWLINHLSAEPATLNPITSSDAYASNIQGYIYESLIRRNPKTLELEPELAESWEISEDHLQYTFHLKRNIRWHDGHPFTAKDILFSFERINDPRVDAAHLRNYYQDILKLEVIDEYTVRYHYRSPYFRALEFCGGIPIVPSHLFGPADDFNQHPIGRNPIGTGPYRFLHWETGKELVLVRNENYWGERPHLDRIVFKIIADSTASFQVLKQGGLDVSSLRPIQWEKQTQSKRFKENFKKLKYYSPSYSYIGWNNSKPPFNDSRVRTAMTMLLDREMILDRLMFGLGTVVSGTFYVKSPEYNQSISPHPYDPAAAVELLRDAGWKDTNGDGILDKDGRPFVFEFAMSAGSRSAEQIATILQENLKRVGIHMEIRKLEWAVFAQKIEARNFDAYTMGWSLGWESDPYQIWHSSQAEKGSNYVGFVNAEADSIIETARMEFDPEKRRKLYHRFHEILHEEQPYTFLYTLESLVAVARRFQNVNVYPMGLYPREWWVRTEDQKYTDS